MKDTNVTTTMLIDPVMVSGLVIGLLFVAVLVPLFHSMRQADDASKLEA